MPAPDGHLRGASPLPEGAVSPEGHRDFAARLWSRMDRDKNGALTRDELNCEEMVAFIKAIIAPSVGTTTGGAGAPYTRAEMNLQQAMSFCFRKADLNSDGRLTFEEFESFTLSLRQLAGVVPENTADLIFALFDLDGDCHIDEAEFREIYRFFAGRRPSEDVFLDEWLRLNPNCNDKVTKEEYTRWLQKSSNPIFRAHAPPLSTEPSTSDAPKVPRSPQLRKKGSGASSEGDLKLTHLYKRGGLSATFGATSPASSTWKGTAARSGPLRGGPGVTGRAKWNNNMRDPFIVNPVHPKRRAFAPDPGSTTTSVNSGLAGPQASRHYFKRHETLPELMRYLQTNKKSPVRNGFDSLASTLSESGCLSLVREPLPATKRRGRGISDPLGPNDIDLPTIPPRHSMGGTMRDFYGRVVPWNSSTPVMQTGERYVNGSNSLRCPGTPPGHICGQEFDDEDYLTKPGILRL